MKRLILLCLSVIYITGCGVKGPPLPPIRAENEDTGKNVEVGTKEATPVDVKKEEEKKKEEEDQKKKKKNAPFQF